MNLNIALDITFENFCDICHSSFLDQTPLLYLKNHGTQYQQIAPAHFLCLLREELKIGNKEALAALIKPLLGDTL